MPGCQLEIKSFRLTPAVTMSGGRTLHDFCEACGLSLILLISPQAKHRRGFCRERDTFLLLWINKRNRTLEHRKGAAPQITVNRNTTEEGMHDNRHSLVQYH
jgi:hypothetical protein